MEELKKVKYLTPFIKEYLIIEFSDLSDTSCKVISRLILSLVLETKELDSLQFTINHSNILSILEKFDLESNYLEQVTIHPLSSYFQDVPLNVDTLLNTPVKIYYNGEAEYK